MSTIAAISTAPGIGGIGIIRLSGKDTFKIIEKIFVANKEEKIENVKGYTIKYGKIIHPKNGKIVDEVLVSFFRAPKSYTTEDMCEINSHGGMVVVREILEICLKNGAIIAEPGEFTKRAFLNGRIDLTQAEAVINVIEAKGKRELDSAINQLNGELKINLNEIKNDILEVLTNIEANIDYPEYDVEEVSQEKAKEKMKLVENKLEKLLNSFEKGKILKDGINIAIVGKPNAGKSSLLNALLKEERAIVTEYEGTTRDTIEEFINVDGIPVKIIDTAGIRDTENAVEQIGINKSREMIDKSDLVLAVFDNSKKLNNEDIDILKLIRNKKSIIILNKSDLIKNKEYIPQEIKNINENTIKISAKKREGIDEIYKKIVELFNINEIVVGNETILTNIRHKNLINEALKNCKESLIAIEEGLPIDIIAINIKEILESIGKITGESVSEEIIKDIFSKFCLGK
ncbi:MAG: tRNA uridine-5-carboxymethylaminomethyl(34) synthesis GTPase MnmE [Clostridiales bacterium]|nr:tRNA uridine-5-carboxymethylaminomethyl(34) synthesis GTPase MnmE [Clostridiales bacterium]